MTDFFSLWYINTLLAICGFAFGFLCGASWAGHFRKRKDAYAEFVKAEANWTVISDERAKV